MCRRPSRLGGLTWAWAAHPVRTAAPPTTLNPAAGDAADHFPEMVRDLLAWVRRERLPKGHPFRDMTA